MLQHKHEGDYEAEWALRSPKIGKAADYGMMSAKFKSGGMSLWDSFCLLCKSLWLGTGTVPRDRKCSAIVPLAHTGKRSRVDYRAIRDFERRKQVKSDGKLWEARVSIYRLVY